MQALKDREAEFPTGINTGEKGVAIPHTDVSHVNKKGIAIATLKQPVEFVEMGTDDEYVNAQVVFMLAVDEKGHLELLQAISHKVNCQALQLSRVKNTFKRL